MKKVVRLRPFVVIIAGDELLDPGHVVSGQVEVADDAVLGGLHDGVLRLIVGQEVRHGDFLVRKGLWQPGNVARLAVPEVDNGRLDMVLDRIAESPKPGSSWGRGS